MTCFHDGEDQWCSDCNECHTCENDKKSFRGDNLNGKSQKARGLEILSQFTRRALKISILLRTEEDCLQRADNEHVYFPQFARPCPVRPRHGFVDSRVVKNWNGVKKALIETLAADPEGELMLLPYINADYNAVWTPTLLTIGRGHDGATSGKDVTTIPIVAPKEDFTPFYRAAGIEETDSPYVEAVMQGSSLYLTQLRAGTPLPPNCSLDFLPRPVEVKEVVKTNGEDLLAWEAITIDLMKREDVIVWHPGGSLTDHYSVHCRERGIPIAITYEPLVGETIIPKGSGDDVEIDIPGVLRYVDVVRAERPDPASVLAGVYHGEQIPLDELRAEQAVIAILMGLHFSPVLTGKHGKWIGVAAALMCRLGSLACMGEARHWEGSKHKTLSRGTVWEKGWAKPLQFHKAGLSKLANIFRYGEFRGAAFGGKNWAMCAFALTPIFTAISKLAREKSDDAVSDLVLALNIAVNQAHNGGWWLNKFNDESAIYDTVQKGDMEAILAGMGILYEIDQLKHMTIPSSTLAKWERWGNVTIKPLPLKEVSMFTVPGIPAVQLVMVPGGGFSPIGIRKIAIPFEKMIEPPSNDDELYLVPGPSGWAMQAVRGEDKLILWEEAPFTIQARKIINGQAAGE